MGSDQCGLVFDAHDRAFAFFKGACTRGIYDNMKTAVDAILVGKDRVYNRRFQQMCGHYLVEPVACTPASGWEKGQVENQVGTVRQRFFSPRVRVRSYEELNAWLLDRCIAWAKAQPHPDVRDKTIWQMFEAERPSLVPYAGPFDGFQATPVSPSKTCLVRFDNNKYSVMASAVGRPVEVRAYADRIELRQDGRVVGQHRRAFGRGETVYDPWHYVPVLARKPGALRNGAPFQDWVLPAALERVRRKLKAASDGDRQMVEVLGAVLTDGLPAVEAACAEALKEGVHSADVILNILSRQRDPGPPATIMTPEALRLTGDERNHHAHILLTTREIGAEGFTAKNRDWNAVAVLEDWREAWAHDTNAALERAGHELRVDHRTLEAQRAEALELAAEARDRGDEAAELAQTVRAVGLDREPLPQLSLGAWQLKERGIEVAAVRVWHEVRERALEVGRVAQELAGHARDWLGRVAERALEVMEPAQDAWGDFFAEAAQGGLRDDLSRDLDRERQVAEQAERVRQLDLVKEREAHAIRDDGLDHGL